AEGAEEVVAVKEVDLLVAENGPLHHTEQYDVMEREKDPQLVVRRGQAFSAIITLSRAYNADKDAVSFIFTVNDAEKPNYGQGTLIAVPLLAKGAESGTAWNAVLESSNENVIRVKITPAADAIVGQWKMDIDTKLKNDGAVSYSHKDPFYILFNPWCRQDQVFLEGDDLCQEYILADTGLIWRGSYNRLRPCVWKFAQFEKDILDCALYLVSHVGKLTLSGRSDPVKTARVLSAAVSTLSYNSGNKITPNHIELRKSVTRKLREELRNAEFESWKVMPGRGRGVELYSQVPKANAWIFNKSGLSASEWVTCLKMNANLAAVRGVPGRSLDGSRCRHGCPETETLTHVLGQCNRGLLLRNARHHHVRSLIATALRKKFLDVEEGVFCLATNGSSRRIDIIAYSQTTNKGYIIDPTIRIETGSSQPEDVNQEKINIYLPTVDYFKAKYQLEDIEVIGLLIGARGVIPKFFECFRKTFELPQTLTADVNSPDDNGVLMGNWSDEYDGGTPPTKWIGSMKILQKFYKDKKPVKYGQCWVFSGVLTTICRALGIPCRSVTNFASAHDTQNSLTVDYFVDEDGEVMEELNSDSIWNFHVWNEVWMERPDIVPGGEYGGWQVIDATPQEESDDMYRCGPASVTAIKRGEVQKPYDNAFVFSEVNADKVFWRYTGPTQPLKLLRKDAQGIGQFISTKAVGKWEREDITNTYKFPEKSEEERAAMLKALRQSENLFSRYYLNEDFNDIKFDFELRDDIVIGSPFSVVVLMKNQSRTQDHTVTVTLRVDTVLYTGRLKDAVKKDKTERLVKAGAVEEIRLDVSYEEYFKRLVDQCAFNIACMATVHDTNYEYFAQDDFRVRKPDIKIKIDGEAIQGQELSGTATLKNPLPTALKKAQFIIEGPGLTSQLKIKLPQNVAPGSEATAAFKMTPKFSGRSTIAAKFVSKELEDVDGFLNFMVEPKKEAANGTGNAA
ncbi:hypothetical protein ANN_12159, partial [Periplaneta americana]